MADRGRGGYRRPSRPAAVSNPQSGQRTDGGPGDRQPIRTPTGGRYGEASALTSQQQAAPLAAGGGGTPPPGGSAGPPMGGGGGGMFAPTGRPSEPITAGAMTPGSQGGPALTADELLRMLYRKRPSPWIARLLGGRE